MKVSRVWLMILIIMISPAQLALAIPPVAKKPAVTRNKPTLPIRRPSFAELTKPIRRNLVFSKNASDLEIVNARVFAEPLVPMDNKVIPFENQALAKSLLAFKNNKNPEDSSDLNKFLNAYPKSRWRSALEMNLAQVRFERGYLTDALKYWALAWESSKKQTVPQRKVVADQSISNLVLLEAQLGLMDSLERHLSEINKRPLTGSVEQKVKSGRNGLWSMKHSPQTSFKCGPFAVNSLLYLNSPTKAMGCHETIRKAPSTTKGTNLAQVQDWADQVGLKLQMAKRSPGSKIIVPAVMHWKVGHFCAITAQHNNRYRIQDPTFGNQGNLWLSAEAINSQTDGYFLVPKGTLPTGWQKISRQEAQNVWGKGLASGPDGGKTPNFPKTCMVSCCGSGMAAASAFSMNATLNIVDYPLGYNPPIGPSMTIGTTYNYNEGNQPGSFTFTNLGQDWSINWLSYLTVDGSQNVTVRTRGGGYEIYDYVGSTYSPDLTSQAQIVDLGGGSFQRILPDGSTENFTLSDGTNTYMTSVTDPQGNAATISYDVDFRITSITDASSNPSTTFTYVSNSSGNPGFYKIASITDGFGRSALFAYDSTTTFLTSITDAVGNVSQFTYDTSSSFINLLTTPYGSTAFSQYTPPGGSPFYPPTGLRFTFPDGSHTVIENWLGEQKETYYWDREAAALYPNDPANHNYSHCTTTRWLWEQATNLEAPVANWTRRSLEAPVVYSYPGESFQDYSGTSNKPIQINKQLTGFRSTATLTGTVTPGDVLGIQVVDQLLPFNSGTGNETVFYTVQSGDTLSSIAAGLAAAINSNYSLQAFGITATTASNVVTITSQSINATTYNVASTGSPTETITFATGPNPAEIGSLGGTVTAGDILTITVHDSGLPGGQEAVNYTVQSADTLTTISQALAIAIGADTNLQAFGVSAVWSGSAGSPFLAIQSNSPNATTYTSLVSGGATETIGLSVSTNGIDQEIAYQRNDLGYITQSIDANGRELLYTYDSNKIDLLSIESPASPNNFLLGQWQYTDPSAPHRPTLYIDGSGQQTQYTYNAFAELATVTDANSNTSTLSYDGQGYPTQIQGPLSGSQDITTFTFYGYGLLNTVTNSEGYTLTYSYDDLNRPTKTEYPDGATEQTIYDRLDAVLHSDRLGRWTQSAYDSLDQLSYEIDPLGRKTSYCWCNCGSLAALTDPADHTTVWHHDLEGRIIEKVYADGTAVNYVYEPTTNRLKSKTDALNQTTSYLYNFDDTVQQTMYSNAVNATSPVTIAYDTVFPRTTNITNNWGTYTYAYNPYFATGSAITGGGKLSSVTNNVISNSAITYSYDSLGRTTNKSINGGSNSTTLTYDAISRVTQEVNPLGTFGYNYINDTSGSSKGDSRLASINYPNSQVTNFSWLPNIGDQRLQQIVNLNPGSAVLSQFNYAYNSAGEIKQWQQQQNSTNTHLDLGYDMASQLVSAPSDSGSSFNAYISGTPDTGDVVSVTAYDASLTGTTPAGQETASYTVMSGDTSANIASALATNIGSTMSNISVTASATGSVIAINTSDNYTTQFTSAVSGGGATDTIALSTSHPIQPLHKQLYYNYDCAGNRTGVQGDSTGSFPTGLTTTATHYAYNNVNELTGTAAGSPIRFQATTTNPVKSAVVNITKTATISGTITPGDVLTIIVHDKALSQAEKVDYTVQIGDSATAIATALKNAINADTTLSGLGITATSSSAVVTLSSSSVNATLYNQTVSNGATETITSGDSFGTVAKISPSTSFRANPLLAVGANTASVTAVSGGGTPTTNTYPVTISSAASQSLTYDTNGNMTNDGTNTYAWDAENRLIKITYPGSNNYSQFTHDGAGKCVKIVETRSGTITDTKQFVWCGSERCEARDAGSTVTAQYFSQGETIGGTNYFYTKDHLGSIREITSTAGTIQSQYSYDPSGQVTKIAGSGPDSDFQYAGYYYHAPSGLNLTVHRAYNANLGRWINRDPIKENGGVNLYAYVDNDPINNTDPKGTICPQPPKTPPLPNIPEPWSRPILPKPFAPPPVPNIGPYPNPFLPAPIPVPLDPFWDLFFIPGQPLPYIPRIDPNEPFFGLPFPGITPVPIPALPPLEALPIELEPIKFIPD